MHHEVIAGLIDYRWHFWRDSGSSGIIRQKFNEAVALRRKKGFGAWTESPWPLRYRQIAPGDSKMQMRITVQTYAGYKGDERPVSFSREGQTFRILDIVDRWYDPDHNCFKVLTDDGKTYLLRHDLNADCWELVAPQDLDSG